MTNSKSIKTIFTDICNDALIDGFHQMHSLRRDPSDPRMKPGHFYNKLPDEIKERIKNELTSEITQEIMLRPLLNFAPLEPWWAPTNESKSFFKSEKLKFETELMKKGWKPDFSHKLK